MVVAWLEELLTVVDLRNSERGPGDRRRLAVEAFQPVTHSGLRVAIVPKNVQQRYWSA